MASAVAETNSLLLPAETRKRTGIMPLKYSGSLDGYRSIEHTPVIGTEFLELQLAELLDDDQKLRDLAITISRRGVCFFRNQNITIEQQKRLATKLGELSGKPSTSKLHKHILHNRNAGMSVDDNGTFDDEVSIISSENMRKFRPEKFGPLRGLASEAWHSDMSYERVPSDYAVLQITSRPEDGCGGDTIWASGYEAYDRLSPYLKDLADSLETHHKQEDLAEIAKKHDVGLTGDRGAPENIGLDFEAIHPVVRTNPVTGWKSLFGTGPSARRGHIIGMTKTENEMLSKLYLVHELVTENHDLQVRFTWGHNDVAIWDNRCTYHTATDDFQGKRRGNRVVSNGEIPFFDPTSKSRREALAEEAA